jgi:hypothetical protein
LIGDQFGHIISLETARQILPFLVKCKLLSFTSQSEDIEGGDAYDYALRRAKLHASDKNFDDRKDEVEWTWETNKLSGGAGLGTERGSAHFLNTVALAAYIVSARVDQRPPNRNDLRTRLVHNPYSTHSFPLAASNGKQDCRPDILGLDTSYFCQYTSGDSMYGELVDVGTPASTIENDFGDLLDTSTGYALSSKGACC